VLYQELNEVGWCQVMEGRIGEEEKLILNEIMHRGDVFSGLGVGQEAGG